MKGRIVEEKQEKGKDVKRRCKMRRGHLQPG